MMFILAVITALAWVPIFLRFFRAWRERKNPISLSICMLIAFPVYSCLFAYWTVYEVISDETIAAVMLGANIIACATFYLSFFLSRKRFNDTRN
jgi:peptidoglycan biosynthesis protein MviN/MurJ (putative lipid II flippase)